MKKYILILIFALPIALAAQMTYVPDDNFEQALIDLGYDTLPLNDSVPTKNIDTVTILRIIGKNISDLTGIEDFEALTELICYFNLLTSLDVSGCTALGLLDCPSNYLTSLDVSKNTSLTKLYCGYNSLTSLDVSKNTALTKLSCSSNSLTSLDVSSCSALTVLDCSWNALTSLNVSKNTALEWLYCNNNSLTSLDVSKNTALTKLSCYENGLTSLDVSKNTALEWLDCVDNPDLYCIQVADLAKASNEEYWLKERKAVWSEDCKYTGVEDNKFENNVVSISPNPASDFVEVDFGNVILSEVKNPEIKIYDVVGVEVASTGMSFLRKQESHGSFNEIPNQVGNDSQVIRIDVSALPKGVYFMSVGGQMYKFIKI